MWLRLVENLKKLRDPRALPGWIGTTTKNEAVRILAERHRLQPVDPEVQAELTATDQSRSGRGGHPPGTASGRPGEPDRTLGRTPETDAPAVRRFAGPTSGSVGNWEFRSGSIGPTRARCLNQLKEAPAIRALAS